MKKIVALLLILMLILSACAKPNETVQDAGASQDQPASEQEQGSENLEEEPHVDPKLDPQWKDPSITDEQRRWFFDFAKEYRIDAMALYGFEPGKPMELDWFKYYCEYFVKEEDKTYVDMGVNYSGKAIKEIAEWFGFTYELADDDQVFIKSGSLLNTPLVELIQYRKEEVDGKTLITARCINYNFNRYNYEETVESRATYPADRAMVLKGEVKGFDSYSIIDVAFYTEDGKTPTQFISAMEYRQWQIEDGSVTVPEF